MASCIGGGMTRFDARRDRWVGVPQIKGLGNRFIYAMAGALGATGSASVATKDGFRGHFAGLWLGTAGGVNYYSTPKEEWDDAICSDGYTDYCVYAIEPAGDCIWFGTAYGLYCRNIKTSRQVIYARSDGLPDDEIVALALNEGVLRVVTKKGLAEVRVE
jgi:hypothetical protein